MHRILLNPDGSFSLGLLLIVETHSGIVYEQQCGGYATVTKTAEGFLIPVGGATEAQVIYDWFWRSFKGHCYHGGHSWSDDLVNELRGLVATVPCWLGTETNTDELRFLELDMTRISHCIEAWIPVLSPYGPGILTLDNSD